MTPCEKLGYKVGDRFEVVRNDITKHGFPIGAEVILKYPHNDVNGASFVCAGYTFGQAIDFSEVRPLKPELNSPQLEVTWGPRAAWYPGVKLPDGYFAYRSDAGVWRALKEPDAEFRHIRTERDKAIDDMIRIAEQVKGVKIGAKARITAGALYDAGYRKQASQ